MSQFHLVKVKMLNSYFTSCIQYRQTFYGATLYSAPYRLPHVVWNNHRVWKRGKKNKTNKIKSGPDRIPDSCSTKFQFGFGPKHNKSWFSLVSGLVPVQGGVWLEAVAGRGSGKQVKLTVNFWYPNWQFKDKDVAARLAGWSGEIWNLRRRQSTELHGKAQKSYWQNEKVGRSFYTTQESECPGRFRMSRG